LDYFILFVVEYVSVKAPQKWTNIFLIFYSLYLVGECLLLLLLVLFCGVVCLVVVICCGA